MPQRPSETIRVMVSETPPRDREEAAFAIPSKVAARVATIRVDVLSKELTAFLSSLEPMVQGLPKKYGTYDVPEISFALGVNGEGHVSLIGGLSMGVTAGITVTLRRRDVGKDDG